VLAEADRISPKHLLTLEPAISETQTNEMQTSSLQLVLPAPLHETYRAAQRRWLMDLEGFLGIIEEKAARTRSSGPGKQTALWQMANLP
jgi:hypothetical protein